jgi:hypothetical protein
MLANANNAAIIIIQWETLDNGTVISSGTDTLTCAQPSAADKPTVTLLSGCEYRLTVLNTHTTGIQDIALQMPIASGSFPIGGTYSGPVGWTPPSVTSSGVRFHAANSGDWLGSGKVDTFYFTTAPNDPGASWPLTFLTYQAGSDNQITDTVVNNVPGCTPPIVCDTVTMSVNDTECVATLTVNNRRTTASIDSVVVIPLGGWQIGNAKPNIPWSMLPIDTKRDSVIFVGNLGTELTQTFFVSFNFGPNTKSFPVMINTYSNGVVCTTIDTMTCTSSAVTLVAPPAEDLALTVVPNPLSSRSDISFTLGSFSNVNVMLVDILGRTQATLFSGTLAPGDHTLPLDASTLAPGTYYIRLETEGQRVTKKIVVEH